MASCLNTFFSILFTIAAVFWVGCSKKEDLPELPAEFMQSDSTPTEIPEKDLSSKNVSNQQVADVITFDRVLQVWATGRQEQAVALFLKIQWDRPDIFSRDSIFRISEEEFAKLPKDQQEQIVQKALKLSKDVKTLAKFIVQEAKQEGGYEVTRNALIACGKRLSRDDQLLLMQLVGKAVAEHAENELPVW